MKKYPREKSLNFFRDKLSNMDNLYKAKCINWIGTTTDTKECYTDIFAAELDINKFNEIKPISRIGNKHYNIQHKNSHITSSNRKEENYAKFLNKKTLNTLGTVIDYQIPLKDSRSDKAGKIDLIAKNDEKKIINLIELKYLKNPETLLRCVLEIETYFRILNHNRFLSDFKCTGYTVKKVVLISTDCEAYKELTSVCYKNVIKFANNLDIGIYVLDDPFVQCRKY